MLTFETKPEVSLGDQFTVLVLKGKADSLISRMRDGREKTLDRENPIFTHLEPGIMVEVRVSFIAQNYIIVDPVAPPESGVEAIEAGASDGLGDGDGRRRHGEGAQHIIEQMESD